jgi:putative ubiquitin-RnfH superfamily antitoxin RatB of RatAB toxin-antitoxin module
MPKAKKETKTIDAIDVQVSRMGAKVIKVTLDDGHTVEDALSAAGLNAKNSEEIYVNGGEEDTDYELEDGDRVVLVKNVESAR